MHLQPKSSNGDDSSEGISNLTTDLIIQTVSDCVQYEQRKLRNWFIAIGVFIWRSRTKHSLRRKKTHYHQLTKDPAAHIPLLAPTTPTTPPDTSVLKEVARIVREKDLNALRAHGGVDGVETLLRSHSEDHADDGGQAPQLACKTTKPVFFRFFLEACNQYTIIFLFGSAGLQFAIEFMKQGVKQGWHDGVAILITVLLLIVFPSVGNYRNERKMVKQLMERNKALVNVERNGESGSVMISHVSVGDIIHLKKGDHAPADGLFIGHGLELVLDEVLSPRIDSENNPFVLSGSKVIEGEGRMVVTSVGDNTAFAETLSLVTEDHNPNSRKTLLQALLDKPYTIMEYLACCVSFLIPVMVLIRLLVFKKHDNHNDRPDIKGEVSMNLLMKIFEEIYFKPRGTLSTLVNVLATVIIGIQHGMPFVISLAICQWREKVIRNRADHRNLSACVTMGLVTVICIETTSEKQCNKMEVMDLWIGEKDLSNETESDHTEQFALRGLHQEISATPANDLFISSIKTRWGTSTTDMELLDQTFITVQESSGEKWSGILVRKSRSSPQDMQQHMNGDASKILDMCSYYNDKTGESPIMEIQMRRFKQVIKNMEEMGLRPIAYAYKKTNVMEFPEHGLILSALVGVRCPYQENLKIAVKPFKDAGINIMLVSEDEPSKVKEQASDLGINPGGREIPAEAFRRLNSMERLDNVDLISVMGNSLPKDIFLMVECLKKKGHIVAFYGGLNVNDTGTLIEADVGITQDTWSTEMARDNADIIVKDGCLWLLNLILAKCAYHNIQNFCQVQLTCCISGLLVTLVATTHSGDSPLTAIHLIWVNLIVCLLGGLMMVMELKGQELLSQRLASRSQPLITNAIWKTISIQVLYQASILLLLHFMGDAVPSMNQGVRGTMVFNIYTLCQVLNLFRAMDLVNEEVLDVVFHSYWFLMASGAVMIMQVVIVEFGKGLASGVRLNAEQWAFCLFLAVLSWPVHWAIISQLSLFRRENLPRFSPNLRMPSRGRFYICASLFLRFSVSYCFEADKAHIVTA